MSEDDRQLLRRRLDLLQRVCPSCDLGLVSSTCTCFIDLAEVGEIEAELKHRGVEF